MKIKLLFVIESLGCGGAEKSLVSLLNLLDYSKYEVDLQLFSRGGDFESMLPAAVNVLDIPEYFKATRGSIPSQLKGITDGYHRKVLSARLRYSFLIRIKKHINPEKAVLFWKCAEGCFGETGKEYDTVIAYAQGTPTFYAADCVRAKKKFAWVNSIYKLEGNYREFVTEKYAVFNGINCVSEAGRNAFRASFPEHKVKTVIIYDINDARLISKMAELPSEAANEMIFGGTKLLTVGRFSGQKGYDIALEACRILKERNIEFCWYALGGGILEKEIRNAIEEKGIADRFILLGTKANPYPYYCEADIYIQTSRFEGFGLAIAEARMLNVPVVTTRFDAVYAQMIEGENGIVTDMDATAVADGIERLITDQALYEHIKDYQRNEKKGNYEEIDKFYELIEG